MSLAASFFSIHSGGPMRDLRLQGLASLFLSQILDSYYTAQAGARRGDKNLEKQGLQVVRDRIDQEIGGPMSLPRLALDVGLSVAALNRLFLKETGKSCADYIRTERLNRACAYLQSGQYSVKQVAAKVGYGHVANFSRAFRQRFGETPASVARSAE
jgi:transcriptional regulator GlxA family with amidase domain